LACGSSWVCSICFSFSFWQGVYCIEVPPSALACKNTRAPAPVLQACLTFFPRRLLGRPPPASASSLLSAWMYLLPGPTRFVLPVLAKQKDPSKPLLAFSEGNWMFREASSHFAHKRFRPKAQGAPFDHVGPGCESSSRFNRTKKFPSPQLVGGNAPVYVEGNHRRQQPARPTGGVMRQKFWLIAGKSFEGLSMRLTKTLTASPSSVPVRAALATLSNFRAPPCFGISPEVV